MKKKQGKVLWFDKVKGYGFITQPEGTNVFVHYTAVEVEGRKELEQGQQVSYVLGDHNNRQVALNVEILA